MLILVDPTSGIPAYRQLMDQIRFHVASGLLAPGQELPSTRVLSAELNINPMTISKAYSLLERDGVLERRPGLPLVVAFPSAEEAERRRRDHLQEALLPAVRVARQLRLSTAQAMAVFRELLERETSERKGK